MERKDQLIIIFILAFVVLCVCIMVYKAKQVEYQTFFEYESPYNGETYSIDNHTTSDLSLYYVYAYVDNYEYIVPLRHPPAEVEDVYLEENVERVLNRPHGTSWLFITQDEDLPEKTDQNSFLGLTDFGKILGTNEFGIYKIRSRTAFTSGEGVDVPVITCDDVSSNHAVIYLRLGDENRVFTEGECLIVEGKDAEGILLASDKFAYHLLGLF